MNLEGIFVFEAFISEILGNSKSQESKVYSFDQISRILRLPDYIQVLRFQDPVLEQCK